MDNLDSVEDLTTLWNFDESLDDLKKQLLRVANDVLLARKESREQERIKLEQVKKLVHLLATAYKERDEAKHQLRILSMVKSQTLPPCTLPMITTTTTSTPATKQEQPFTTSVIAHVCSLTSCQSNTSPLNQPQCGITNASWTPSPNVTTILPTMPPHSPMMMVDNYKGYRTSCPTLNRITPIDSCFPVDYSPEQYYLGNSDSLNFASSSYDQSTMLDNLAKGRARPEKGKLLQSVMEAGPLLDSLLMAGPMPQWSNPPQLAHAPQVPPVPLSMSKRPRYSDNSE